MNHELVAEKIPPVSVLSYLSSSCPNYILGDHISVCNRRELLYVLDPPTTIVKH